MDRILGGGDRLAGRTASWLAVLNPKTANRVIEALLLGIDFGKQAKLDEEAGDQYAHQKAAYEWGCKVGDPKLVSLVRHFWEGVQLGVFAVGDLQERKGYKSPKLAALESAVGGNGKDYTVNRAYLKDIMADIDISTDGARVALSGRPCDFGHYLITNILGRNAK